MGTKGSASAALPIKPSANIEAALRHIAKDNPDFAHIRDFRIQSDPVRERVQLVVTTVDNRQYLNPHFLDQKEITDDLTLETLRARLLSTIYGKPSPSPEFSLCELEQAQEFINQCKS